MTKEEFINLARTASDRPDLLSKMNQPFSLENVYAHIRTNRIAFGITKEELFSYFTQPTISKDTYISYVSGSKSDEEVLQKIGQPTSSLNRMKYVTDVGNKYNVYTADRKKVYNA
jgi:hypothetical protein